MTDSDVSVADLSGDRWDIAVRGEYDISNVSQIQDAFDRVFATGTSVMVDLSEATFIDSTVIRTLINAHKRASETHGERLVLIAPPDGVADRVFTLAGVKSHLPVHPDSSSALDALHAMTAAASAGEEPDK